MKPGSYLVPPAIYSGTALHANYKTADSVRVNFRTMAGNQPGANKNFISIWQDNHSIPWTTQPLDIREMNGNTAEGILQFSGLDLRNNSYIIGYSVGPLLAGDAQPYGNICASAFIPARSLGNNTDFTASLTLVYVGDSSVAFNFTLPEGVRPRANGAWAGIWQAGQASYKEPPLMAVPISVDAAFGTEIFNDLTIGRGLIYTIGLFMSGFQDSGRNAQISLACSLTFTI